MVGTRRGDRRGSGLTAPQDAPVTQRRDKRTKTATPGGMATPNNVLDLAPSSGEPTRVGKKRSRYSRGDTGAAQPRTRRALAPTPPPAAAITDLNKECLTAVFRHCSPEACRLVLPLVCKRWAEVLGEPSAVWKTIVVDRRPEVAALRSAAGAAGVFASAPAAAPPAAPVSVHALFWARKRALGVQHLAVGSLGSKEEAEGPETSNKTRWMHRLMDLAAPSLATLALGTAPRADGYSLKWLDLQRVLPSKGLRSLAVRGVDDGPLCATAAAPLAGLPALRELTLAWTAQGLSVTPLPPALFTLTALRRLSLSSRQLAGTLPRAIARLHRLEALALEDSALTGLPEEFSKLSALTSLSLARNAGGLLARPATWETIAWLPALLELDVSRCDIRQLTALAAPEAYEAKGSPPFKELERLDLSGNPLGPSPSIPMLSKDMYLKHLAMNRCSLALVPDGSVPECEGLESLEVADNALVDLPASLRQLRWLRELKAGGNPFPAVPAAVRESPSLRRVDLRRCGYLESATSLAGMVKSAPWLRELRLEKEGAGVFQESTKEWLREAAEAFEAARRTRVVTY